MDTLVQKCYFYCHTPTIYENGNPLKCSLIYSIYSNIKKIEIGLCLLLLDVVNSIANFGEAWCFPCLHENFGHES